MGTATTTAAATQLLSSAFMARLDQLDVTSRKLLAGKMKGERRSKRQGQSVEFADYRNYTVGDDLRFIDWNIYARLDRLFLKLFLEEEDLSLYVLVDTSKSCDYGTPNKAHYIKQVAAALGYVGLVNYNRVTVAAMTDTVVADTGAMRGRTKVRQMVDFVVAPAGRRPERPGGGVQAVRAGQPPQGRVRGPVRLLRQERVRERPEVRGRRELRLVLRADRSARRRSSRT